MNGHKDASRYIIILSFFNTVCSYALHAEWQCYECSFQGTEGSTPGGILRHLYS
jgi:hypothetical protein